MHWQEYVQLQMFQRGSSLVHLVNYPKSEQHTHMQDTSFMPDSYGRGASYCNAALTVHGLQA